MMLTSFFARVKRTGNRLLQGQDSIFQLVRLMLLRSYGFPDLFFRLPQTIKRLFLALCGRYPFRVHAFTPFDLWLRSYYSKLVRNFRESGRWGYVWDESLGFPMGPRFGSNWVTYAIYGSLSPQQFSMLSLSFFLLVTAALGMRPAYPVWHTAILFLMLIPSPVIIFSLVAYTVKPEVIWWWMAIPMIFFGFQNQWTPVWIFLSVLLLVNTSVATLLGIVSGALWLSFLIRGQAGLDHAMLWLVPGVLVRALRFSSAMVDGNLGATVNEQSKMSVFRKSTGMDWGIMLYQFADFSWSIFLPCLLAAWPEWVTGSILGTLLAVLWFVSLNWFKIADTVTLNMIVACAVIALALASSHWISLLGVFLVIMKKPFAYLWQIKGRRQGQLVQAGMLRQSESLQGGIRYYADLARDYPWFSVIPLPAPARLMQMLDKIPNGSRIMLEGDGNPREEGNFIRFHDWAYEILPDRQIEFINHTFLNRMLEPALAEHYLNRLSVPALPASIIDDICFNLGVRYFVAYSEITATALGKIGYQTVSTLNYSDFSELADLLLIPDTSLTLLVGPRPASIISPEVEIRREKNALSWQAQAGVTYSVRYRYYPQFLAFQGNTPIPVMPYKPLDDIPLRFMSVQARNTGILELIFGRRAKRRPEASQGRR